MSKVINFDPRKNAGRRLAPLPSDGYLLEKFLGVARNKELLPFYRRLLTPLAGTELLTRSLDNDRVLRRSPHTPDVPDISRTDLGERFIYALRAAWYATQLERNEDVFYEVMKEAGFL